MDAVVGDGYNGLRCQIYNNDYQSRHRAGTTTSDATEEEGQIMEMFIRHQGRNLKSCIILFLSVLPANMYATKL
jgi:hypothetical protein